LTNKKTLKRGKLRRRKRRLWRRKARPKSNSARIRVKIPMNLTSGKAELTTVKIHI
jgi:hypothetical protein